MKSIHLRQNPFPYSKKITLREPKKVIERDTSKKDAIFEYYMNNPGLRIKDVSLHFGYRSESWVSTIISEKLKELRSKRTKG